MPPIDDERPSKTERKREMHELQALGESLLTLPASVFNALAMDERLREALEAVPRMRTREARRRQMQYVGKLLRLEEAAPLRAAMEHAHALRNVETAAFKALERWRERLLDVDSGQADAALTEWVDAHPGADVPALRRLIRSARREQAAAGAVMTPDGAAPRGRHYRALFVWLREAEAALAT